MPWLTSLTAPTTIVEGQLYSGKEVVSRFAQTAAIRAGLLVQRGTTADGAAPLAALPAADNDSIVLLAAGVTAVVAGQRVEGAQCAGAYGQGRIFPPQRLTYTFNNNANWGLAALGFTGCRTIGLDPDGRYQEEDWDLPAGGNVVITTDLAWSQHYTTLIGECDGAGGGATLIVGTSGTTPTLGKLDYGIAAYERAIEPSATATVTFDVGIALDVVLDGTVGVIVETTAALAVAVGDPVAVRIVAAGADVRGQFTRASSAILATGNYALVNGAHWISAAAAGSPALIRIGG